jgi:hypothetical protein
MFPQKDVQNQLQGQGSQGPIASFLVTSMCRYRALEVFSLGWEKLIPTLFLSIHGISPARAHCIPIDFK